MSLPNITYIDEFIHDGQSAVMSTKNFYETILVGSVNKPDHIFRIPTSDFFIKYKDQLAGIIQYYSVSESKFYQPKTVSYEIYQTTEMWLSLLRLNDMRNITEFHTPIIRIYNPTDFNNLINIFFKREGKTI